jgi:hypothetical protein
MLWRTLEPSSRGSRRTSEPEGFSTRASSNRKSVWWPAAEAPIEITTSYVDEGSPILSTGMIVIIYKSLHGGWRVQWDLHHMKKGEWYGTVGDLGARDDLDSAIAADDFLQLRNFRWHGRSRRNVKDLIPLFVRRLIRHVAALLDCDYYLNKIEK